MEKSDFLIPGFKHKLTQYYITVNGLFNEKNEKNRKRKKIAENTIFFCVFHLIFNGLTVN